MSKYLNEQGLTRLVSLIKEKLNTKVDKVEGKTLSTNDYTDEEKDKLNNIVDNSNVVNGSKTGSLRGVTSSAEDDSYKLGMNACSLGALTKASGVNSFSTGTRTKATALSSHVEGNATMAKGNASHAEGDSTVANGNNSHAEGDSTYAINASSHTEGIGTVSGYINSNGDEFASAYDEGQHVQGKYNLMDETGNSPYAHIVGNGSDNENRSNAHTIDWDGNAWFAGNIKIGGTGYKDTNSKTLATTEYIDNNYIKIYDISELKTAEDKTTNLEMYQEIYNKYKSGQDVFMTYASTAEKITRVIILYASTLITNNTLSAKSDRNTQLGSGLSTGITTVGYDIITIKFSVENDMVTSVSLKIDNVTRSYIETNSNYETVYMPKFDGSPATKKYVDDSIDSAIGQALARSY